jgi:hypothetical protein
MYDKVPIQLCLTACSATPLWEPESHSTNLFSGLHIYAYQPTNIREVINIWPPPQLQPGTWLQTKQSLAPASNHTAHLKESWIHPVPAASRSFAADKNILCLLLWLPACVKSVNHLSCALKPRCPLLCWHFPKFLRNISCYTMEIPLPVSTMILSWPIKSSLLTFCIMTTSSTGWTTYCKTRIYSILTHYIIQCNLSHITAGVGSDLQYPQHLVCMWGEGTRACFKNSVTETSLKNSIHIAPEMFM